MNETPSTSLRIKDTGSVQKWIGIELLIVGGQEYEVSTLT